MSVTGSSSNIRQATKGGSLPGGRLDEFSKERRPSWIWGDNDPSSFLRKIVSDLLQRERAVPSLVDGKEKIHGTNGDKKLHELNGNGASGALHADDEIWTISPGKVPVWKPVLDITCILLSLPVWLPLMILTMLVTRACSSGPIFYRQERIGLGGRRFSMWKFRTMKLSADTKIHERHLEELIRTNAQMTKLDAHGDPRLVPFGRIIRASGLDELPQIFNVLRREMSLVGPRPCLPNEFARYELWQRRRVNVLPGLTGYWQVNGKNNTTFNQMIAMDLAYLENMSISLDVKIILKTGGAILAQVFESRD